MLLDGSATPVPGSPFALAGDNLTASPNGNFLFGDVNGATHRTGMEYFTYAVATDGSLATASSTTQVATDPQSSGVPPQSVGWTAADRAGSTLYSWQGLSGSTNTAASLAAAYSIGSTGSLTLIGSLAGAGTPISFTPDDRYGYSISVSRLMSYLVPVSRNADGTLSLLAPNGPFQYPQPAGLPPCSSPYCESPSSSTASPVANDLAVTFVGTGTEGIAVYPIHSDGTLDTPTAFLPLTTTNGFSEPWHVVWDSTGNYLFASDYGKIYVLKYDALANTLSLVSTTITVTGTYALPDQMDFLNEHLFATNPASQALYIYNFSNGTLAPASDSPLPLPFTPYSPAALQR